MIELSRIGKSFGQVSVIDSVSLTVRAGELVVLAGPSGSGKSALLRMIAGLEDTSRGECVIAGKRVNDMPAKDRGIAMVFQNYALYPHMKVFDNLAFALKVQGKSRRELRRRVAATVQLTEYLRRKPSQLSGGQRQRVAMARAMVRDTGLFLFDEPISSLDAKLRGQMRVEVRSLHDALGATSVYVTNNQTEAMTLPDRIVVLNKGSVELVGTSHELYENPQARFAAGFLGASAMNFIEQGLPGLNPGEALGVRPENTALRPGDGTDLRLDVELEHFEYPGACTLCHSRRPGQNIVVQLGPDQGRAFVQGQNLKLYVGRDKALKFSGNRRKEDGLAA